ncbi:hypothetical protein D3C80_1467960 [compost metagenome]
MAQCQMAITLMPGFITLVHFAKQLARCHRQHQRAHGRNKETGQVERIQATVFPRLQTARPRLGIGFSRRHRQLACFALEAVYVLRLIETEWLLGDG